MKQLNNEFKTELLDSLKLVQTLYPSITKDRNIPENIVKQIENKIFEI